MARKTKIKNTILNDPIYGFISIPYGIINKLIDHAYFQRLRRIKQLGLTHLVYPGAYHTRFQHALGAMHLMGQVIDVLRSKGHKITGEEETGVLIAILLHDIGHGPFSHVLENSIVKNVTHEYLSDLIMGDLNTIFRGKLDLAIKIFENKYRKKFLHQLVASQLDMDRLDYLKRDSFFTGVAEGVISSDRIIKTLNIVDDNLVLEAKGIYSVESFLIARRLMYWQVYLHKTVISAEYLLIKILQRAKEIIKNGGELFATPALEFFLKNQYTKKDFVSDEKVLKKFAQLDDYDIFASIKTWMNADDIILSRLSSSLVNRELFHIEIQDKPFTGTAIKKYLNICSAKFKISNVEARYFVFTDQISNSAYNPSDDKINILYKSGDLVDIAKASDQLNVSVLSKRVRKYFLCVPKEFKQ
ncbi:MAG TPA: HD domain-containing protein [Flavobacteriales bacterium]|nr:HD domain-containing protein [Flavobacteriales bacterium]HIN39707.1 HD domain-containing protein [Flavobacteriales bacterium]